MKRSLLYAFCCSLLVVLVGCAKKPVATRMLTTAYCGCQLCCDWQRGSSAFLHLDFWNKYISAGKYKGRPYSGLTAKGTKPKEPQPGLFSADSVAKPWMIPVRTILFPWFMFPKDGTIAADTRYYPFGTRIYVPGYGWGVVEDRGGAIKGRYHIDLYFSSHQEALNWGRKTLPVNIVLP